MTYFNRDNVCDMLDIVSYDSYEYLLLALHYSDFEKSVACSSMLVDSDTELAVSAFLDSKRWIK